MNPFHALIEHPLIESTGWALIHFVWQAAAIAALLAVALLMLRHASSGAKYVACCVSLLLMAAAPLVTTFWLLPGDVADPSSGRSGVTQVLDVLQGRRVASGSAQQVQQLLLEARDKRRAELNGRPTIDATPAQTTQADPESITLSAWLQSHLSWVVSVWSLGVILLSVRLLLCWLNVGRRDRSGTGPVTEQVASLFADLSSRVGVSRGVRLLESSLVQVPTVLGALQPVILLPAIAVTGLSSSQLQAILAHELAHVRRHDYLVNLLQTAIETLLFYHPAVWWLSRRIRQERENCCDDVASSVCGNRLEYAQALVRMEEVRATTPRLAVASTGGSLTQRVRRLIGSPVQPPHEGRRGWWLGGVIPMALLLFAASCISKVATDGPGDAADTSGSEDTYVVVWGAVLDRPLADQLLAEATKFDEQEGWTLQTIKAAPLREQLHKAADSAEIIRLYERMSWLAPLGFYMPPEHLTSSFGNSDNVQFREPGDRAHIVFTQDMSGVHRVLPADDHVRLKLQTQHSARFEAFNTTEGDVESEHRGQIDTDHQIANGDAMLVTRVLDPLLDWSPVVISVFEPVRVPSRRSQQRQIHDLPTWLAAGPQGIQRRAKAANNWTHDVAAKTVPLAGEWSQLLESGSRVTLVGLSSPAHCPTAWWTPDGEPLQFDFDPNISVSPPQELIALLHVMHTPGLGKKPEPIDLKILINTTSWLTTGGVHYLAGSHRSDMPNSAEGQLVIVPVPPGDEPTLDVGVGTGMQPDQHVGVVKRDEPLQVDAGEIRAAQILKRKLHIYGEVTNVSMTHPRDRKREILVTAVTSGGKKLTSQFLPRVYMGGNSSKTASVFDRFPVHADQIKHFEIDTAPLSWVTFSGFSGLPATLREQLTAAAEEPTPVMALVGWTFQGNETAFNKILGGAKQQNLGDRLSWFLNDSESVRRQYLKLRNDGHADPPGPIVGTLFDFDQFMEISGAGAYRGPALSSFPFGYSSGILAVQKRASTQGGMWTLEVDVTLSSADDRAWQIGGRWLVQENMPNEAGRSQWSDVFDQKLKLTTKLPPGRVAVFTGPVPGMDKSDRTGFVELECIPIPHTQVMKVRGLDKDVEKVLRQGPLMALATLDDPESPAESEEQPKPAVSVRGRVPDAETGSVPDVEIPLKERAK